MDAQTKARRIEFQKISTVIEGLKIGDRINAIKTKKNEVVISKEDFDRANQAMDYKYYYESKAERAEEKARDAEYEKKQAVNRNYEDEIDKLLRQLIDLRQDTYALEKQNKEYYSELTILDTLLDDNPALNEAYQRALKKYQKENQSQMEMD